jgi:hypothetical protein
VSYGSNSAQILLYSIYPPKSTHLAPSPFFPFYPSTWSTTSPMKRSCFWSAPLDCGLVPGMCVFSFFFFFLFLIFDFSREFPHFIILFLLYYPYPPLLSFLFSASWRPSLSGLTRLLYFSHLALGSSWYVLLLASSCLALPSSRLADSPCSPIRFVIFYQTSYSVASAVYIFSLSHELLSIQGLTWADILKLPFLYMHLLCPSPPRAS